MYETSRLMFTPLRMAARSSRAFAGHAAPFLFEGNGSRMADAALEIFDDALRDRKRPEWGLDATEIDGEPVDVFIETVAERPFCSLIRFRRRIGRDDPKILIVAPLSGHFATLLRDTVRRLLPAHDIYITEWKDASTVPLLEGGFDLDDYLEYLLDFMRIAGPGHSVIAVCQPAPIVVAATSLLAQWQDPAQPAAMVLMGGPVDTAASETMPTRLANERSMSWFETRCITLVPPMYPGAARRVYPGFLQLGAFIAMNADRHLDAHMRMFSHLVTGDGESAEAHRAFYDEYLAVMDVTADYYLQTLKRVFRERWLATNRFVWRGNEVRPDAITRTALMTVEGELDDISGPGQTAAAHAICRGIPEHRHRTLLQQGVGHYGIFNGRRWRNEIAPRITEFIRDNRDSP